MSVWYDEDNVSYNRFTNLDGVEDKILFYLLSEKDKNPEQLKLVHEIWRVLFYNDEHCLINDEQHPLPKYKDIMKLLDNNGVNQTGKRLFRYPFVEDSFVEECAQIRIYIDSIIPITHLSALVNIGVDVIIHNKIVNILNDLYNEQDEPNNLTELSPMVTYKNRSTLLLKNVIALLNGADIAGVGKIQFNIEANRFSQSLMGKWNNRNFFGYKTVFSCVMSGVA